MSSSSSSSGSGRARGAEGVGDPLVRGVSLPVEAVGVDLRQNRDAVPGPAGGLGGPHSLSSATPNQARGTKPRRGASIQPAAKGSRVDRRLDRPGKSG